MKPIEPLLSALVIGISDQFAESLGEPVGVYVVIVVGEDVHVSGNSSIGEAADVMERSRDILLAQILAAAPPVGGMQ